MSVQQEVSEYLSECKTFFFGTVCDGAPVIRPLGFQMCRDGQLYFGVGKHKDVYAQLTADPHVYVCACKPDGSGWIRFGGTAVCDDDPALVDAAFEVMPDLKPLYESNGWEMGVFHLQDATVTYVEGVMNPIKTETF